MLLSTDLEYTVQQVELPSCHLQHYETDDQRLDRAVTFRQ